MGGCCNKKTDLQDIQHSIKNSIPPSIESIKFNDSVDDIDIITSESLINGYCKHIILMLNINIYSNNDNNNMYNDNNNTILPDIIIQTIYNYTKPKDGHLLVGSDKLTVLDSNRKYYFESIHLESASTLTVNEAEIKSKDKKFGGRMIIKCMNDIILDSYSTIHASGK